MRSENFMTEKVFQSAKKMQHTNKYCQPVLWSSAMKTCIMQIPKCLENLRSWDIQHFHIHQILYTQWAANANWKRKLILRKSIAREWRMWIRAAPGHPSWWWAASWPTLIIGPPHAPLLSIICPDSLFPQHLAAIIISCLDQLCLVTRGHHPALTILSRIVTDPWYNIFHSMGEMSLEIMDSMDSFMFSHLVKSQ